MRKFILIILPLLLLSSTYLWAQASGGFRKNARKFSQGIRQYVPSEEKILQTWYHYVVSKAADNRYVLRTFHPERQQVTAEITFSNKQLSQRQGTAKFWYDNGQLQAEGLFDANLRIGKWQFFTNRGLKIRSGSYQRGMAEDQWETYDGKGRLKSVHTYRAGQKEGPFSIYDSTGTVIARGVYRADTLLSRTPPLTEEAPPGEVLPHLKACASITDDTERNQCNSKLLTQFIRENIRYPKKARAYEVQGKVVIRFVVNKDGKISDIEPIHSLCGPIEEVCIELVRNLPPWEPGRQQGAPVRVQFDLPFTFQLE